jgi:hypothetical protein
MVGDRRVMVWTVVEVLRTVGVRCAWVERGIELELT